MDSNKVKITMKNKDFEVTLDKDESLYLELINKNGEIYLSNVPKKNNEPLHNNIELKNISPINLDEVVHGVSMNTKTVNNQYKSTIFDVLNDSIINTDEKANVTERSEIFEDDISYNKQTSSDINVADSINELQIDNINKKTEIIPDDHSEPKSSNNSNMNDLELEDIEDDMSFDLELDEEEGLNDSYESMKSRYLDFDEE